MTITGIIFILIIGVILVLLEILVIPGVAIVGGIGALMILLGVYFSYEIDMISGHFTLGGAIIFSLVSGGLAFRAKTWEKFSLKEELEGKVNLVDKNVIHVGDRGITMSKLVPAGKAKINEKMFEVHSKYGMIENNVNIEVSKIESNKIIVIKLN